MAALGWTMKNWAAKKVFGEVGSQTRRVVRAAGLEMVADIKNSMTETPRSGVGGASLPGHPPAVQYGTLRASIEMDDRNLKVHGTVDVGATGEAPYAVYLELGVDPFPLGKGEHPGIAPRPFLRPALDKIKGPLMQSLKGLI